MYLITASQLSLRALFVEEITQGFHSRWTIVLPSYLLVVVEVLVVAVVVVSIAIVWHPHKRTSGSLHRRPTYVAGPEDGSPEE